MPKIAVITDTDASLPLELAQAWDIVQVPITIHFGEQILKTTFDINDRETFARIDEEGILPTTAAPAPGDFAAAYQEAAEKGAQEILCITVSSKVSATYQTALTARELVPELDITVVDSYSLSLGQGFQVLKAARLAHQGYEMGQILTAVQQLRERSHLFAALSTLKYMAMSGRIGHLTAGMASMFNIKPILSIQDGKLDLLEKVRTRQKAWKRVIELTREKMDSKKVEQAYILHVDAEAEADAFRNELMQALAFNREIPSAELTPGLSVHAGAGLVGLAFVVED